MLAGLGEREAGEIGEEYNFIEVTETYIYFGCFFSFKCLHIYFIIITYSQNVCT